MKRPAGNNADEWAVFLEEYGVPGERIPYICVQIACAIDDAELRGTSATSNPADELSGANTWTCPRCKQSMNDMDAADACEDFHCPARGGNSLDCHADSAAPTSAGPSLVAAETEACALLLEKMARDIRKRNKHHKRPGLIDPFEQAWGLDQGAKAIRARLTPQGEAKTEGK